MATIKQIEANRRNAQKSTGPRSPEGKAASRLNALKHGVFADEPVIIGEETDAFHAIRQAFLDRFQPAGVEEETLVYNLIRNAWLLDRFSAVEIGLWDCELENSNPDEVNRLSRGHRLCSKQLAYLQRRIDSAHRNYRRDLELLLKLQKDRPKPNPQPGPAQSHPPENGFVPANSAEARDPAPSHIHPISALPPRPSVSAGEIVPPPTACPPVISGYTETSRGPA
jgi:hypothetical protein